MVAHFFFVAGDGAGVGKGRIVAGMIYQNYLEGRKKAVWYAVCVREVGGSVQSGWSRVFWWLEWNQFLAP